MYPVGQEHTKSLNEVLQTPLFWQGLDEQKFFMEQVLLSKAANQKKKKKGPIFLFHSQLMCIPNEPEVCIVQKLQISKNDN